MFSILIWKILELMQAWNVFPANFCQKLWQRWPTLHWDCTRVVATGISICILKLCEILLRDRYLLQAKTKDLPSESHSVQNISDPIGQNTSQVKQNCCSKVFWTLKFQDFSLNSWRLLPDFWMPKNTSALSHMQMRMHILEIFSNDKPPICMTSNDISSF